MSDHQLAPTLSRCPRITREDILRAAIPKREDVPTLYEPVQDYFMIVPLPEQTATGGGLLLPDRHTIVYNEGHIVQKGPLCSKLYDIGDCVTWNQHSEFKVAADDVPFVLLKEGAVLMRIPRAKLVTCPEGGISESLTPEQVALELDQLGVRLDEAPQ